MDIKTLNEVVINNCKINGNIIFPSSNNGIIKNSQINIDQQSNNYLMGYFDSSIIKIESSNITPQAIFNNCSIESSGNITINSIKDPQHINDINDVSDVSFILMLNSSKHPEGNFIEDPPIFSNRFFNPEHKNIIKEIITYKGSSNLGMIPFYGVSAIYIFDIPYDQWITVESSERESTYRIS